MADIDEDAIPTTGQAGPEEIDLSDETQDFRFLAALSTDGSKIPKRGEKDFEPHATALQSNTLAASRQAMHNALSVERSHHSKGYTFAVYHPETNMAYALKPKGVWISKMGQVLPPGKDPLGDDEHRGQRLWLQPEEALYLLERGTIDIRWPSEAASDQPGVPMSLQAAYAVFLGDEPSHNGALTFERYSVYTALRRGGYTVIRAPSWNAAPALDRSCFPPTINSASQLGLSGLVDRVRRMFASPSEQGQPRGLSENVDDLVGPGYFRSYSTIYRRLALIDAFDPEQIHDEEDALPVDLMPIRVAYYVYKPNNATFKKTAPGRPDFRIAVLNARETGVPTMQQLSNLMASQPYEPPPAVPQFYSKLKHGYKSVVIAVVDQGITSYLRFADAAFSKEKLYLRAAKVPATKRGGKQGGKGRGGR